MHTYFSCWQDNVHTVKNKLTMSLITKKWMPHNSTVIKCIEISKIISSVINMLANMLGKMLSILLLYTFPCDNDLDTTRTETMTRTRLVDINNYQNNSICIISEDLQIHIQEVQFIKEWLQWTRLLKISELREEQQGSPRCFWVLCLCLLCKFATNKAKIHSWYRSYTRINKI